MVTANKTMICSCHLAAGINFIAPAPSQPVINGLFYDFTTIIIVIIDLCHRVGAKALNVVVSLLTFFC